MTKLVGEDGKPIIPSLVPAGTESPFPLSANPLRRDTTVASSMSSITSSPVDIPKPVASTSNSTTSIKDSQSVTQISNVSGSCRPRLLSKHVTEVARRVPKVSLARTRSATIGRSSEAVKNPGYSRLDVSSDVDLSSSSSDDEWVQTKQSRKQTKTENQPSDYRKKKKKQGRSSSGQYSRFNFNNDEISTKGKVDKQDGRLNISVNATAHSGYLANALGAGIKHRLLPSHDESEEGVASVEGANAGNDEIFEDDWARPRLNIVVIVIGSRGDIQPFLKIGKILKNDYGHRVRIATHPAFKDFVEKDSGLEFFSVGGDPSELMAFMVKNPGLIPSIDTVKAGEIGRRRASMYEMFEGMWRACINASDDEHDEANMQMMGDKTPFVADAMIANPPSFAHVHIAERLGIPLHMMFTFPYSPTVQFPHPLSNIKRNNADANYTNFMSYPLVELMTWQGLGDLVNKFRVKSLGLEPVSKLWAPGQLHRLKVPYTYMWSPNLVPKPSDWGPEIDIAGFVFLELASSFTPPDSLVTFLEGGPPPVYIGFGSIVVDDPNEFTKMIFEAVKIAGVRALVSKGWGGFGGDELDMPDDIYMLENTPHDWLFPKCSAVVHHGGAGTSAAGLKFAKPTMIVPFFGDQPFWGAMISKARAGAFECIPYKDLNAENLAAGIKQCLTEEANENVRKIAKSIEDEGDGAINAVRSFHRHLPVRGARSMRCSILENRVAVWNLKGTSLRLSALAADILVEQKKMKWQDLRLIRHYDWNDFDGPGEPLTGAGSAFLRTVANAGKGVGGIPSKMSKSIKKKKRHDRKKRRAVEEEGKASKAEQIEDENALHEEGREEANRSNGRPAGPQRGETELSALSTGPSKTMAERLAEDAAGGFVQTGTAIAKAPMDMSLAIARGFHNAPRLYGDETVRRPVRISGFKSGLKAGGSEFVYGLHDAVTGVVTLPYRGARDRGPLGCLDGIGMGFGGLILKSIAALFGPFAYVSKGIHEEIIKSRQPTAFLRKARIVQAGIEIQALHDSDQGKSRSASNALYWPRENETMESIESKVEHGWRIVLEVLDGAEMKKDQGLFSGHFALKKEEKKWRDTSALESIGTAEKSLDAKHNGKGIDDMCQKQKTAVEVSEKPKESTTESTRQNNGAIGRAKVGLKSNGRAKSLSDGNRVAQVSGEESRRVTESSADHDDRDVKPQDSVIEVTDFATRNNA